VRGWGKREQGLGIARFVRFRDRPDAADASIVVADEIQRKGLGSALFCRLMQAAQERGIQTLRCEVLATNTPALRLLDKIAQQVMTHREGRTVIMEIRIDDVSCLSPEGRRR
jgi:ribosomal protein S18 acetylase RimI-like enzyme